MLDTEFLILEHRSSAIQYPVSSIQHPETSQLPQPNITVAYQISVILEYDRAIAMSDVFWKTDVLAGSFYFRVVLHHDAIVDDGDTARRSSNAVNAPTRGGVDDVVGLPFAGRAAGIHKWYRLFVNRGSLPIWIGCIVETIEHLHFVAALQEDAAVASALALSLYHGRCPPFDVQLAVAKYFFGKNIPRIGLDGHGTILHFPLGGCAVFMGEFVEIRPVEQHDGIAWSSGACAGRDDFWHGLPSFSEPRIPFL